MERPRSEAQRALVTGGAGFIGGHIVERLVREGWSVRVLDDFSTGRESNLGCVRDRVDVVRGDLADRDTVEAALDGVNAVFHEGAIASVPQSVADPVRSHHVNVSGTVQLLACARDAGVKRIVFAASSAAYGNDPALPKCEDQKPDLLSPYAAQKQACEVYLRLFFELYGVETVALRYFNVYGPRQDPKGDYAAVIPLFIDAALRGRSVSIYGDGEQTRDFVYVEDVVEANLRAATQPGVGGALLNVASGARTSVNDLVRIIGKCVGVDLDVHHEKPRLGDVLHSWADVSRVRDVLGFVASTDLEVGLQRTVDAYKSALR